MTTVRSAEANGVAAPRKGRASTISRPGLVAEMKARQSAKIRELGQVLIDVGLRSLDDQANALGLPRSTAWTILKTCHKSSGLSAAIIERMLGSSKLPPRARAILVEYVEEKSFGLLVGAGDSNSDLSFACPTPSQAPPARANATARARRNAPDTCAPTAADEAAFALSDLRYPGWMWCSTPPGPS